MTLDPDWIAAELKAIAETPEAQPKGARLEALMRTIFEAVPGLVFEGSNIKNSYGTEEIDILYWNEAPRDGLHFLDCPLIVECKSSGHPVPGRDVRYFATLLKDKSRRNGILIALNGVTGDKDFPSAAFFHLTAAMIDGVTVLVITGDDLRKLTSGNDLVRALRVAMTEMVKRQVLSSG
ncbi:hypothetical protein [Brevundimonas sp. G8]|uniref:restriction endonuclease n=1 Tax=Brevundimonas sp. G8 TaxID=1350776 RepID=UPI0012F0A759|nr:hypothetical protein [Brevundimonas sp. G8]VXB65757.1 conserved hypothetical protein [Brevundimonas sp. G8]